MESINNIFARAVCEVWRERLDSGECTLLEAEEGLKKARDSTLNEETKSNKG